MQSQFMFDNCSCSNAAFLCRLEKNNALFTRLGRYSLPSDSLWIFLGDNWCQAIIRWAGIAALYVTFFHRFQSTEHYPVCEQFHCDV